jgi:hypothetical protein
MSTIEPGDEPEKQNGTALATQPVSNGLAEENQLTDVTLTTSGPLQAKNQLAVQGSPVREIAAEVVGIGPPLLTEDEARKLVTLINQFDDGIRYAVLRLYEGQGWEALGYKNWHACAEAEFNKSKSRIYQLLEAARVERNISNALENGQHLPHRAVLQLKDLTPEQQREVYAKADEIAGDAPTTTTDIEAAKSQIIPREQRKPTKAEKRAEDKAEKWKIRKGMKLTDAIEEDWTRTVREFLKERSGHPTNWLKAVRLMKDLMDQIETKFLRGWIEEEVA